MVNACRKIPLVFDCEGEKLVGVLTLPANVDAHISTALIALPAGGPQYRVGLARQLLKQAEYYASENIATLRFDYRGIGDSDGQFQGFDAVVPDLEAAITALSAEIPELKDVILWGGCNAASAIMMHAWRFPLVSGIIASNPYMGKHNLAEKAKWLHFANRLRQASFWKKLFSGQFTISAYLPSISALKKKRSSKPVKESKPQENKPVSNTQAAPSSANNQPGYVLEQMLNGLNRYTGQCLMFMSENSIQSNEFKVLLKSSRQWRKVMKQPEFSMLNLPGADQNISSVDSQKTVRALTKEWLIKSGYAQK